MRLGVGVVLYAAASALLWASWGDARSVTWKVCDVTAHGAKPGTDEPQTQAIQAAIDDCAAAGGGTVLFPAGSGPFTSAPLWLKDNIEFVISPGVTLLGSTNQTIYPAIWTRYAGLLAHAPASLLNAGSCLAHDTDVCTQWSGVHNLTIHGGGAIDGQGLGWWLNPSALRPTLFGLANVTDLVVEDLSIKDSPFWNVHLLLCTNVLVRNLTISAPSISPNTDGIDPDSSTNVLITNCTISTGDDVIAVKSGKAHTHTVPCSNVTVEHIIAGNGHGISIGSEMSGGVELITFRDITLSGTNTAVRIKSCAGRGGYVRNVTYANLALNDVGEGISVNEFYTSNGCGDPTTKPTPVIGDVLITNITGTMTTAGSFKCLDASPCYGINLSDVNVTAKDGWSCSNASGDQHNVYPPITCLS